MFTRKRPVLIHCNLTRIRPAPRVRSASCTWRVETPLFSECRKYRVLAIRRTTHTNTHTQRQLCFPFISNSIEEKRKRERERKRKSRDACCAFNAYLLLKGWKWAFVATERMCLRFFSSNREKRQHVEKCQRYRILLGSSRAKCFYTGGGKIISVDWFVCESYRFLYRRIVPTLCA